MAGFGDRVKTERQPVTERITESQNTESEHTSELKSEQSHGDAEIQAKIRQQFKLQESFDLEEI